VSFLTAHHHKRSFSATKQAAFYRLRVQERSGDQQFEHEARERTESRRAAAEKD